MEGLQNVIGALHPGTRIRQHAHLSVADEADRENREQNQGEGQDPQGASGRGGPHAAAQSSGSRAPEKPSFASRAESWSNLPTSSIGPTRTLYRGLSVAAGGGGIRAG